MYQDREQEESPRLKWQIESVVVSPWTWGLRWPELPEPSFPGEVFSRCVLCAEIVYRAVEEITDAD